MREELGAINPPFEDFREMVRGGNLIPVWKEIMADVETPVTAFMKICRGPFGFLLESVEGGERWARFSFIGGEPREIFESKGRMVRIRDPKGSSHTSFLSDDPLSALKEYMGRYKALLSPFLPPFQGGAVGYISYDMVRFFERLPDIKPDDLGLPDMFLLISDTFLVFDHLRHTIKAVSNAYIEDGKGEREAYEEAVGKIEGMIEALRRPISTRDIVGGPSLPLPPSNFSRDGFEEAVKRSKEYIRAGDIIQVVLSQRFEAEAKGDPFDSYRALRYINPSPYMFYLKLGGISMAGSSPEVFLRVKDGVAEVRPIAGTRRRGRDEDEDRKLEVELLSDPKERAEHVMLVDLGRNDIGRVCRYGTVKVTEFMVVERYSHVMHIVSHVSGILSRGVDSYDAFRACFPAGTVTGAPKIRAMEIIEEMEPVKRGPYAGAVGYFSFTGDLDSCITIRTILFKGDKAYIQVGAGIVADSVPEREYEETCAKARALFRALELSSHPATIQGTSISSSL
jgi:anthranilate synthase component 1